jgi:hypothetical protein
MGGGDCYADAEAMAFDSDRSIMIPAILADNQHFHSTWQIDTAITAKAGGTLYGCYRQACRETHKRWRGLRDLYYQIRIAELDLEDLKAAGDIDERKRLDIERKRLEVVESRQVIRDSEREFLRFAGQALACRRALGLVDSETMPEEMRERLDAEFWEYQIRCLAAVDFITQGRLSKNVVELLVATHGDTRQRLAREILDANAHENLVGWYLSHEPEFPEPVALDCTARSMIECASEHLLRLPANGTTEAWPYNLGESIATA